MYFNVHTIKQCRNNTFSKNKFNETIKKETIFKDYSSKILRYVVHICMFDAYNILKLQLNNIYLITR